MYFCFGWVVGNVGLLGILFIVIFFIVIILFIFLLVSAIVIDRIVRGGGVYYMISWFLGFEIGGVVGIFFYFV